MHGKTPHDKVDILNVGDAYQKLHPLSGSPQVCHSSRMM